jgi:hypothetical protein
MLQRARSLTQTKIEELIEMEEAYISTDDAAFLAELASVVKKLVSITTESRESPGTREERSTHSRHGAQHTSWKDGRGGRSTHLHRRRCRLGRASLGR